jgi:iron complex outermembrane recepter protein
LKEGVTMSRQSLLSALVLLLFSLFPAALAAQPAAEAAGIALSGRVTAKEDGRPVPGARVAVEALGASALTGPDGRYTLTLPGSEAGRTVELRVTASGLTPQSRLITLAPSGASQDFALGYTFTEEITVGSRAAGTESEKAVPVDTITAQEIENMGFKETSQVIQFLVPSFNYPRTTTADASAVVRPVTLRGLGSDQVLVLVNGKRRHSTALVHVNPTIGNGSTGVDFNAIPVSAIAEITVLRDGAAAQYGSDAIAGVVNIALKAGPAPLILSGQYGAADTDQGIGEHRADGGVTDDSVSYGWEMARGWGFASVEWRDRNRTNRAGIDTRDQIVKGDGGKNAVAQPNHWVGDSTTRDLLGFFNSQVPVTADDSTFFYAFGGLSRRFGVTPGLYRRAIDDRNWPQIYPEGFLPLIDTRTDDVSGTFGLRGDRLGWSWDLSLQYGQNAMDFNISHSLNASLGPNLPPNQTAFYAGNYTFGQAIANFDVTREVNVGLAGPLNIALGLEYRDERYRLGAGEPNSYIYGGSPTQFGTLAAPGDQVFPGVRPDNAVSASRGNGAVYADLEADLTRRLRLGLAGRYEHYSDFGGTTTGKLTARYQLFERLVLRGAASTGFRAPSLVQSHYSATSTTFANLGNGLVALDVGTFPVDSPQARTLGARPLKPEDSKNYSAGFAWNPVNPLSVTLDFYRIDIDDRIVLTGNLTGPKIVALLAPFGASAARFFTNAINTRTEGYDLVAAYVAPLSPRVGRLNLEAAYNNTSTRVVGQVATPPQLLGFENVLFDRQQRRRLECAQPNSTLHLSGDFERASWGSVLRLSRYGQYCSPQIAVANEQYFSPKWITDLEASYRLSRLTFSLGVLNLFDIYPERQFPQNALGGILRYSQFTPYGINGRTLYGRIIYRQ